MTRHILYIGSTDSTSTSRHRLNALRRLGNIVQSYDPEVDLNLAVTSKLLFSFHYRTGFRLLQTKVLRKLSTHCQAGCKPDLVWVNSGELLGPRCLRFLNQLGCPTILYNNDDPTGQRDGRRFDSLRKSIPHYCLCVVRREINIDEYRALGAKRVHRVWMSYDEVAHAPCNDQNFDPNGVIFIGTRIPKENREVFLSKLLQKGVPVTVHGAKWDKCSDAAVRNAVRGGAVSGSDYVRAIQSAKVCLGLLSKGNRDQHTRRSVEVPFAGGLLCAERTPEHTALYREGEEAVFWSNANECASLCKELISCDSKREYIRRNGAKRVRELGLGNEDICRSVLDTVFDNALPPVSSMDIPLYQ